MQTDIAQDPDFSLLGEDPERWLAQLESLREIDPVFWSEGQQVWIATRHADLVTAFRGDLPLSNHRIHEFAFAALPRDQWTSAIPTLSHYVTSWLVNIDAPHHRRLRPLLIKAFNKRVVENIRSFVCDVIDELLEDQSARPVVEFTEEIARVIPTRAVFKLLGVPDQHIGNLARWSFELSIVLSTPGASVEQLIAAEKTLVEITKLFAELIEQRKAAPGDDLISEMLRTVSEGDRMTMDDMIGICQLLLIAGQETTSNSLAFAVLALDQHPKERAWLASHPESVDAAAIELSRHTGMSATQTRLVTQDFSWHGKQLKAGQIVYLMIWAANRDPRVFDNPTRIDFNRADLGESLTFAPGLHHCVGHLLARMQISEFLLRAYKRYDRIEVLEDQVAYHPFLIFRALKRLNVKFHPREMEP